MIIELIIFYISSLILCLYLCVTKIYYYNKDNKDYSTQEDTKLVKITINNYTEKNENQ